MPNIHPMLVHFPIGLIIAAFVIDIIGLIGKSEKLLYAGTIITIAALVGAVGSVVSGFIAEDSVWHPGAAHELLELHELMAFITLGVIAVVAIVRWALRDRLFGLTRWLIVVLMAVAVGFVGYTGYLGGEMVYTYGTGVKAAEELTAKNASLQGQLNKLRSTEEPESGESEHEHQHEH